jgi:hypothetical protein
MWIESQTKSQNYIFKGISKYVVNKKHLCYKIFLHPYMVCRCKFTIQKILAKPSNFQDLVVMHLHNNTPCPAIWQWLSHT